MGKQIIEEESLCPVIHRLYPLEKIIEAHEYVERGYQKGNVVIEVY